MASYILLEGGTDRLLEEDGSSILVLEDHTSGAQNIGGGTLTTVSSLVGGAVTASGAASIGGGTLTTVASLVGGALTVSGAASIGGGTLTVAASLVGGALTNSGAASIGGATLTVMATLIGGAISGGIQAESINSTTWRSPRLTSSTWKHTQGY